MTTTYDRKMVLRVTYKNGDTSTMDFTDATILAEWLRGLENPEECPLVAHYQLGTRCPGADPVFVVRFRNGMTDAEAAAVEAVTA